MEIGGKAFASGKRTYVMGILNVTPDSFSDGGKYSVVERAVSRAEEMAEQGADIIDVGGESTRPGYIRVDDSEEIRRVVPVIREIKRRLDVPVSIDTYKSRVAEAALEAGAALLNDIWGLRGGSELAPVAAKSGVPICLMHNRARAEYRDVVADVLSDLRISILAAKEHGIAEEKIILDPGIGFGFGKTAEQSLALIKHLDEIVDMGYPVLVGASRKSVIGQTLDLPAGEREEGTISVNVWAAAKGCGYIRVHDVEKNVRALRMLDAIKNSL